MDTTACPQCQKVISARAKVCPQCGASMVVEAIVLADDAPQLQGRAGSRLLERPWVMLILLLHLGILGIPLYWRSRYGFGIRMAITLASLVYTIVALWLIWWGIGQIMEAADLLQR